jgi:hypothetical protein
MAYDWVIFGAETWRSFLRATCIPSLVATHFPIQEVLKTKRPERKSGLISLYNASIKNVSKFVFMSWGARKKNYDKVFSLKWWRDLEYPFCSCRVREVLYSSLVDLRLRGTELKLICKLVHSKGSQLWFHVGVLPTFTPETHKTPVVVVPFWLRISEACVLSCVQILQACLWICQLKGNAYGFNSERSSVYQPSTLRILWISSPPG